MAFHIAPANIFNMRQSAIEIKMRNAISPPKNRITQGTIFCGVKSPYDDKKTCHGICITARCDTAREFKAPTLTFLPVVPLEDWLWEEALPKAIEDQTKSAIGTLKKHLIQTTGTSIILDAFGVDAAFQSLNIQDKSIKKQYDLYNDTVTAQSLASHSWTKIPSSLSKKISAEASLLISGKTQDYFFIDAAEANYGTNQKTTNYGHVALLRDIRTISRTLALKITEGLDTQSIQKQISIDTTANHFSSIPDAFICPTGELTSPFIEQLMQNFSMLFGRIGTKEVSSHYTDAVNKLLGVAQ